MVWKNDSGTNRVVKQLVDIKRHIGQEVHHPFGVRTLLANILEPNILPEDPETCILYLRHWNTIRTEEVTGNGVQDRYNFTLHDMTASTFPEMVRRIFRQQTTAFKINLSFGFILVIY
jgi:hypothetical protein